MLLILRIIGNNILSLSSGTATVGDGIDSDRILENTTQKKHLSK